MFLCLARLAFQLWSLSFQGLPNLCLMNHYHPIHLVISFLLQLILGAFPPLFSFLGHFLYFAVVNPYFSFSLISWCFSFFLNILSFLPHWTLLDFSSLSFLLDASSTTSDNLACSSLELFSNIQPSSPWMSPWPSSPLDLVGIPFCLLGSSQHRNQFSGLESWRRNEEALRCLLFPGKLYNKSYRISQFFPLIN